MTDWNRKNDEMWERLQRHDAAAKKGGMDAMFEVRDILYEEVPPLAPPPAVAVSRRVNNDTGAVSYEVNYENQYAHRRIDENPYAPNYYPKIIYAPASTDAQKAFEKEEQNLQEFAAAQEIIPIPETVGESDGLPAGTTHYVQLPEQDSGETVYAVLRSGFISSNHDMTKINSAGENGAFDTFKNDSYTINQKYFTNSAYQNKNNSAGHPLQLLEQGHPIQMIREGFGANADFYRVAVWNSGSASWDYKEKNNPAFIDSRILKRPRSYFLQLEALDADLKKSSIEQINSQSDEAAEPIDEEAEIAAQNAEGRGSEEPDPSLPVRSGITWNTSLPLVPVPDPDPNFVEPDWTVAEMCKPILNKKTCEYNITVEVSSDELAEDAKRKGIEFLLNYHGKKFYPTLIERLMYLGGKNYSNIESGEIAEGLFASVRKEHGTNRDDGIKKYLVAIPQTYFDHPWLIPDETKMMSRQEYLDNGLVSYSYYIENKDIQTRVDTLINNLNEFKTRVNNYDGTLIISAEDIDKKIERLKTFKASIRKFLELNDEDLDNEAGVIEFALDNAFKVVYVTYVEDKKSENISRFLRKGTNCINITNQVFEDQTASAYLFYADQIKEAIKKRTYSGIDLVQKFTFPIPNAYPSKKSPNNKSVDKDKEQEQKELSSKSVKTRDEVRRKNVIFGDPAEKEKKAQQAVTEHFPPGDEVFNNFDNLLESVGTITELFNTVLNKVPLFNLLAKASLCLLNKLGPDNVLNMITSAFLSMIKSSEMLSILTNRLLLDLMEKVCPGANDRIESMINDAFELAIAQTEAGLTASEKESVQLILDEIINARFDKRDVDFSDIDLESPGTKQVLDIAYQIIVIDLRETNLLNCLLKSLCEAIKTTSEPTASNIGDLYGDYKQDNLTIEAELIGSSGTPTTGDVSTPSVPSKPHPGTKGFLDLVNKVPHLRSIDCEVLVMVLETKILGLKTEDELIQKNMDQIGIRLPTLEYSDDPMEFLDVAIEKAINKVLNEVITPIIKTILEELGLLCQGLNINTPLDNKDANPRDYSALTPDELESLPKDHDNFFDQLANSNLPGDANILDGINPAARANLDGVLSDIMDSGAGIPLTPGAIAETKNLLDVLSNILRPTELCTLLSGEATRATLKIILTLVQNRPEFSLISQYLKSTDEIAKVFHMLGKFVNQNYCSTATEDITLISILCEESLNEDLYNEILRKKGFTPEQSDKIINQNKDRDRGKLAALNDLLNADDLSDYFQDNMPNMHCTPDVPGMIPVNNDYMDAIINTILDTVLSLVKMQFEAEARGIKSALIKEEITPYGGELPRPPELGRDYMNTEIPTGSIGTPMEGKLFTYTAYMKDEELADDKMLPPGKEIDDLVVGEQIIENWPMVDKVNRFVAPRFIEESKTLRTFGSIGYSSADDPNTAAALDATIAAKKFTVSINHLPGSVDTLALEQKKRINALAKEADVNEFEGFTGDSQAIYQQALDQLDALIQAKVLVEYRLPSYAYLNSVEFAESGFPDDYCSFKVGKFPIKKKGKNAKTITLNVLENSQDPDTLSRIGQLQTSITSKIGGALVNNPTRTPQEHIFAKILTDSLNLGEMGLDYDGTLGSKVVNTQDELALKFADLFPFVLANKQNEIVKECLNSRFFSAYNLDKLITSPLSKEDMSALKCSDYPNVNLDQLRKSLLDFDEVKSEVKDFYNDLACETDDRAGDETDPLDDAIRYGMILISVRLIIAEIVFRSLFFFSRFNAKETMENSSVFTTLVLTKLKEMAQDSKTNPRFFTEIKEITRKKLINTVTGHGKTKILTSTILIDASNDIATRQFTDVSKNIYNISDLSVIEAYLKHNSSEKDFKYQSVAQEIFNRNSVLLAEESQDLLNEAVFGLFTGDQASKQAIWMPIANSLRDILDDLAVKDMINKTATKMAPRVNSLLLDKDRKNIDTTKTLLSSNMIFDLPSDLVNLYDGPQRQFNADPEKFDNTWKLLSTGGTFWGPALNVLSEEQVKILNDFGHEDTSLDVVALNAPVVARRYINLIDYQTEIDRTESLGDTMGYGWTLPRGTRNICLDAYDVNDNFYAHTQNSTFYDRNGKLTELGKATRNGGFIVQKFVKVKLKGYGDLIDTETAASSEHSNIHQPATIFREKFISLLVKNDEFSGKSDINGAGPDLSINYNKWDHEFYLSYKQFDSILTETLYHLNNNVSESIWFDLRPDSADFKLNFVFDYIKHGARLVYVMPHSIDSFTMNDYDSNEDFYSKFATTFHRQGDEELVANGASDSEKAYYGNSRQIENLLVFADAEDSNLRKIIRNNKIYQIKEPYSTGKADKKIDNKLAETDKGSFLIDVPGTTPIDSHRVRYRSLKSIYIIPIDGGEVLKNLTELEEATHGDIARLYDLWQDSAKDQELFNFSSKKANVAFNTSIVETYGVNPRELVDEIFELVNVKVINNYVLSSTNLLNFAVLQQAYFPYSNKFDLDELFKASKVLINDVFEDSSQSKNDWSMNVDLTGWTKAMDSVMSAQTPDGAFYQWLLEVIPKFILRYLIAATDPCMKDAFDQQDENGWDDRKLPEIVFGSLFTAPGHCSKEFDDIVGSIPGLSFALDLLGISVPGDKSEKEKCLPGIRPTPVFPPWFPFFGDPTRPVTVPGLIYIAMQFLTGFDQQLEEIELEEVDINPNLPTIDVDCGDDSD